MIGDQIYRSSQGIGDGTMREKSPMRRLRGTGTIEVCDEELMSWREGGGMCGTLQRPAMGQAGKQRPNTLYLTQSANLTLLGLGPLLAKADHLLDPLDKILATERPQTSAKMGTV